MQSGPVGLAQLEDPKSVKAQMEPSEALGLLRRLSYSVEKDEVVMRDENTASNGKVWMTGGRWIMRATTPKGPEKAHGRR